MFRNKRWGLADSVNAVSWSLVLFGGDRRTRCDPPRAKFNVATREGGEMFDVSVILRNVSLSQTRLMP